MSERILRVSGPESPIHLTVELPTSKSVSNRLLVLRMLSGGIVVPTKLSDSDDTRILTRLLDCIKNIPPQGGHSLVELDAGNAGTVFRFLTAFLAITDGGWLLTGSSRMQQRPVRALVDALRILGADIRYAGQEGFPPLVIRGRKLAGGNVVVDARQSSQFVSALMLIAPSLQNGLIIEFDKHIPSSTYIHLTAELMRTAGIRIADKDNYISILPGWPESVEMEVESDWSAASYWFQIAALAKSSNIFLKCLHRESPQGDAALPEFYEPLGVQTIAETGGIRLISKSTGMTQGEKRTKQPHLLSGHTPLEFDLSRNLDLAPSIAVTCAGLGRSAVLKGIANLRIKESDRLTALCTELAKINPNITASGDDQLWIPPGNELSVQPDLCFQTWGDHRIAMAIAPLALVYKHLQINDPHVVSKSYPDYWQHLKEAGFDLITVNN